MSDSELVAAMVAGPGGDERPSKVGVATATSTTEVASCSPTSTTFSPHFMCWWMISCPPDAVQAGAQGSPRPSSSRSRSRRSCSQCPSERRFLRLARTQLGHLFPYIPKQPGYNKRLQSAGAARSAWSSSISPGSRRRSASGSGCWTPRRSRAASRARPANAPSWPAGPPTATAPRIRATSGACGSTCCARRTGCRSASVWPRPTTPSARSPRRCSIAPATRGLLTGGEIIVGDKGFAGHEFERSVAGSGRHLRAPRPQ